MLTRRQFFARMKKLGFSKSRLQMTRIGLTYDKDGDHRVSVTVPKHHEQTFTILGDVPYSGIFVQAIEGRSANWGIPVVAISLMSLTSRSSRCPRLNFTEMNDYS